MICPETVALGSYLLDAIDADERVHVERHLTLCQTCRDELASLAPLPGMLSRLTVGDVVEIMSDPAANTLGTANAAKPPGPGPDTAVLSAARIGQRARRQWLRVAVAATAAVVATVLVVGGVRTVDEHGSSSVPTSAGVALSATDPVTRVSATALLNARQWGTEVTLRLSGLPPGETCHLVIHTRNGGIETSGTWTTSYTGAVAVPVPTSVAPSDIGSLDVVTADRHVLVHLPRTA